MPKPAQGETREHYMSRCVRQCMAEGLDQKAAVGKCEGMYDAGPRVHTIPRSQVEKVLRKG